MVNIERLTQAQEELIPVIREKWIKAGLTAHKTDRDLVEFELKRIHENFGLPKPDKFVWVKDHVECAIATYLMEKRTTSPRSAEELYNEVLEFKREKRKMDYVPSQVNYGKSDVFRSAVIDFLEHIDPKDKKVVQLNPVKNLSIETWEWVPFEGGTVIILETPDKKIGLDNQGRLHELDGPAIHGPHKFRMYAVHGIILPPDKWWIVKSRENPKNRQITPEDIFGEPNTEIRRIMLLAYGAEKLVKSGRLEVVHRDDFGTLYKIAIKGDVQQIVHVVNSTREPDGSYKDYYLGAHPDAKTAREAISRSFQLPKPEMYDPQEMS